MRGGEVIVRATSGGWEIGADFPDLAPDQAFQTSRAELAELAHKYGGLDLGAQ
jgi:hypothetical protein